MAAVPGCRSRASDEIDIDKTESRGRRRCGFATASFLYSQERNYAAPPVTPQPPNQLTITRGDHGIPRANRLAPDALEAALKDACPGEPDLAACQARRRFRIEHAQIIHPADQHRMHALGIIPSLQPTHATSDMAYRMCSLVRTDTGPVLGSDFPVEPPNPFAGRVSGRRGGGHSGRAVCGLGGAR
ncbi:hypothetical protein BT67DRAFT_442529 [Trichocladium antarcticum]|uniref:Amidohydrolase 3 domain-containing protein n=1 Tax=Trichocladium antarcticum TaxID=1450529 RepID=A0AAN6ULP3_9PEZI|nr:hypothetical protein BT67DRAFT_442529 [Trichocladium antarcticum]